MVIDFVSSSFFINQCIFIFCYFSFIFLYFLVKFNAILFKTIIFYDFGKLSVFKTTCIDLY